MNKEIIFAVVINEGEENEELYNVYKNFKNAVIGKMEAKIKYNRVEILVIDDNNKFMNLI